MVAPNPVKLILHFIPRRILGESAAGSTDPGPQKAEPTLPEPANFFEPANFLNVFPGAGTNSEDAGELTS